MKLDKRAIAARREEFFSATRRKIPSVIHPDGSGKIPQFNPPWREPVWILPALLRGERADVELANRMVERYNDTGNGGRYNVFQSNLFAGLLAEYDPLLTDQAREVMLHHAKQVFRTYEGSAQSDLKFHGCNDNMPMMSTKALILGGEKLNNQTAYAQGVWNLNEFRRLLSRAAWASEFNSSTYSAITLSNLAKIASLAKDPLVRKTAEECECRLWAELLLHYHPGTRLAGGPQCRAYAIDCAGHTHSVQALFWLIFGPELSGRDLIGSYFHPDGIEVIHFAGNHMQSVAEFCDMFDTEFHLPEELAELIEKRTYPALTRGRSESMMRYSGCSGEYHTVSYMEEEFSLGTVDTPLCGGEQTLQLFATYKRKPVVKTFRDSATVFYRYRTDRLPIGVQERSADGGFQNEKYTESNGWAYAIQKTNAAMLLTIPNLVKTIPLRTDILKLDIVFPAHYGTIRRSVIGDFPICSGASGTSSEVCPVSIETGEVYLHIVPLIPTSLQRKHALRFLSPKGYQVLELINYEGETRLFEANELEFIQNGFVFTIDSRRKWKSLEEFHRKNSDFQLVDYTIHRHRFIRFKRSDVQFEVCYTPADFGVQTHAVDGRNTPEPVFETNQLNVAKLPFLTGEVPPDLPLFPWGDSLEMHNYPGNPWIIGSRGLPGEKPYSRIRESLTDASEKC